MAGYHLRWIQEGTTWKAILDMIQPVAIRLASTWSAEVTREQWDAPKLDLRWYTDDDIGRAIQVLIEGGPGAYEFHIGGSAWKDFDPARERRWKTQDIQKIPILTPASDLNLGAFELALEQAYCTVSSWKEIDLRNRDPLPPRDPNLTGRIVRGRYVP